MKKINAVLIIDDDPIYSFLIKKLIQKLAITDQLIVACNCQDALQKIKEFSHLNNCCPELIIMDVDMPFMDGIDFLKLFKELEIKNKEEVMVIVNSSVLNELNHKRLKAINIHNYFQKPLNKEILMEVMNLYSTNKNLAKLKGQLSGLNNNNKN